MARDQIELIKYMLEDIRQITLKGVSGLTKEQLFAEPIRGEFPIGAYLMHLGECDLGWLQSLTGKDQDEELKKKVFYNSWFDVTAEDYSPPKEAPEPAEYITAITEARDVLFKYLDSISDENLEETVERKRGNKVNKLSRKWMIYHIIEHEAHTRGQIFMLIRMAGFKSKGANN